MVLNNRFPVFQRYDPNFISASLDEAYLDITEVCRERDLKSDDVSMLGDNLLENIFSSFCLFTYCICSFVRVTQVFFVQLHLTCSLFFFIAKVAEEIRRRVFEETGLTCSAGVGPNRLLAKVLSFTSTYRAYI